MSTIFSSALDRTLYALAINDPRAIPNASGVWTTTGTQRVRFNSLTFGRSDELNSPVYHTGLRSRMMGKRGRQGGTFTLNKPVIPSGAAGTAPDDDQIFQSIFGATATIVAATSATYNLTDALKYLFLPMYNKTPGASSPTNSYLLGAIPQSVKFTGGQNFLDAELSGICTGVGTTDNFASYTGADAVLKGGLTTYPAEPTVAVNGDVVQGFGFGASFSVGGSALAEVRGTCEIQMNMGVDPYADSIGDAYIVGYTGGLRQIGLSQITCIDSDGSVLKALKQAAWSKAGQTVTIVFGNVAGSIITFTLRNVQIGNDSWEESGSQLNIRFGDSPAHASSTTVTDEMTLAFT